jgi:hypothetical protein
LADISSWWDAPFIDRDVLGMRIVIQDPRVVTTTRKVGGRRRDIGADQVLFPAGP